MVFPVVTLLPEVTKIFKKLSSLGNGSFFGVYGEVFHGTTDLESVMNVRKNPKIYFLYSIENKTFEFLAP